MSTLNKHLRMITTSAVLALGAGAASNAFAAPVFTVDPSSLPGVVASPFDADFVNGGSSARVTALGGGQYQSVGYITYGQFQLNANPINSFTTGLGNSYGLYATFTQTFSCPGSLGVGVTCGVTGISLELWADPFEGNVANINSYNAATLAADASVTVNGTDIKLGTADTVISGLAGLNALGGAFENVITNFLLTADGEAFFIDPIPFYTMAFSNFNNTSQGIQCAPNCANALVVAITNENGGSDFNKIPEPATLALVGLGLLGVSGLARRRTK